jgi:hypothetical protein
LIQSRNFPSGNEFLEGEAPMKGFFKPKRLIALGTGVLLASALAALLASGPLSRSQAADIFSWQHLAVFLQRFL